MDSFLHLDTLEFAQLIFNNMSINAIQDTANMILKGNEGDLNGEN